MGTRLLRTVLTALTCLSIASAGLISASTAQAAATEQPASDNACTNVTILGLRGSDNQEKYSSGNFDPHQQAPADKFGVINSNSAEALKSSLPDGTTFKKIAVPYVPSILVVANNEADTKSYRNSMALADTLTVNTVIDTLKACSQTKIVIIGYGQGAQVAHESAGKIPSGLLTSVGGIWMISDPLSNPDDPNQFYYAGSNPQYSSKAGPYITVHHQAPGQEANDVFIKGMGPSALGFPASLKPKLITTCSSFDWGCNSDAPSATDGSYLAGYSSPKFTAEPARRIAESIASLCSSVTFFAARGSGEPFTGEGNQSGQPVQSANKSDYMQGFGVTLASMAYAIESKFPTGSAPTFSHVAVNYDAISVTEAESIDSQYPHSVKTGIKSDAGPEQFRQLINRCPDTQVIMLGYSQGGHVIHEIVMELSEAERAHITTTVLVADASRNPNDDGALTFMGTPLKFESGGSVIYNGMGMMRAVANFDLTCVANNVLVEAGKLITGFFQLPVLLDIAACHALPSKVRFSDVVSQNSYPKDFFKKVLNVCAVKDVVCDTQAVFDAHSSYGSLFANFADVGSIHGEGYKNPEFYNFPSSWAYSRLILTNAMRQNK